MTLYTALLMLLFVSAFLFLRPARAKAHCDTMDGPTARDGLTALETGNINYALKWIEPDGEAELQEVFALARKVRVLGHDARELADRFFLENLVRIHRAGEGEGFTGIKPHGVPMDPKVAAADQAIAQGSLTHMEGLFTPDEMHALQEKFDIAMALKDFDPNDLPAARRYTAAYVTFLKLAEGEEHTHGAHGEGRGAHANNHGAHSPHHGH